jgi:hypothetical protein
MPHNLMHFCHTRSKSGCKCAMRMQPAGTCRHLSSALLSAVIAHPQRHCQQDSTHHYLLVCAERAHLLQTCGCSCWPLRCATHYWRPQPVQEAGRQQHACTIRHCTGHHRPTYPKLSCAMLRKQATGMPTEWRWSPPMPLLAAVCCSAHPAAACGSELVQEHFKLAQTHPVWQARMHPAATF